MTVQTIGATTAPAGSAKLAGAPRGTVITINRPATDEAETRPATRPQLATLHKGASSGQARGLDARERTQQFVQNNRGGDGLKIFGEDGFTFGDLIDIINPLQHIPVLGTIYRWITGDEISPASSLAGGMLYGGPLGLAAAAGSVIIEEATGDDIGGHIMTAMTGRRHLGAEKDTTAMAARETETQQPQQLAALPHRPAKLTMGPRVAMGQTLAATQPAAAPAVEHAQPATEPSGVVTLSEDQFARLLSHGNGATATSAPRAAQAAGAAATSATVQDAGVADRMMLGLEKYEAMARARNATGAPRPAAGSLVNTQG